MMAATAEQEGARPSDTTLILNPEQMRQIMESISGGTRKPKASEPEVYREERHKHRSWLAQIIVYYRAWEGRPATTRKSSYMQQAS